MDSFIISITFGSYYNCDCMRMLSNFGSWLNCAAYCYSGIICLTQSKASWCVVLLISVSSFASPLNRKICSSSRGFKLNFGHFCRSNYIFKIAFYLVYFVCMSVFVTTTPKLLFFIFLINSHMIMKFFTSVYETLWPASITYIIRWQGF